MQMYYFSLLFNSQNEQISGFLIIYMWSKLSSDEKYLIHMDLPFFSPHPPDPFPKKGMGDKSLPYWGGI
jgi:hypothetical protein